MSQGNSQCSYPKQTKTKVLFFLFYKIREQEGRTGPAFEGWFMWKRVGGEEGASECKYCV
jgi:hypothetical protein